MQMATRADPNAEPRTPLRRERVLRAAVDLADTGGIASLSMRRLAQELGVEAMSLYRHVRNKVDIVDGMVDLVFVEVGLPAADVGRARRSTTRITTAARSSCAHSSSRGYTETSWQCWW